MLKTYTKKKEVLNKTISALINDIKIMSNENVVLDKNINQVNIELYELKKKIDNHVTDRGKLAAELRYTDLREYVKP